MLLVGADDTLLPALREALLRHSVHVEAASIEQALEVAVVAAPDLILLTLDAARSAATDLLPKLAASPVSSVIPVVLLGDEPSLAARLSAFRHGAAAVIPRSASIDAVARRVAELAREIPDRQGEVLGELGEATLEEFVSALTSELRSGILSVQTAENDAPVRLVFGSGRPLAAFVDEFVLRVRRHVVHAEPLKYEFDARAGGTVQWLPEADRGATGQRANIDELRVLLADDDPSRADQVAQALRAQGAEVAVCSLAPAPEELVRLRGLDPEVVLLGERQLQGQGYALLQRLKRDTRLRWASLLVVRWEEVLGASIAMPAIDRLKEPLSLLTEPERGLADRVALGDAFDARLEVCGPARSLRALTRSRQALRVSVSNPRLHVELDLAEGLVVGASADTADQHWEGAAALAALLVISTGRLHVQRTLSPATTNLMAEVVAALAQAELEPAPIAASLPPPSEDAVPLTIPQDAAIPREFSEPLPEPGPTAEPRDTAPPAPARRRIGVSKPFTLLLVALGVLQGLLAVSLLRWSIRQLRAPAATAAASPTSSAPRIASSASVAETPARVPAPSNGPVVAPLAALPAAEATPAVAAEPGTGRDESGLVAPSCEVLSPNTRKGDFPGAAYEQLKQARKALVQGKFDQAQAAYCKAVSWDSQNAGHYFELGQLLLLRKDGAASAEWIRRGLGLDPANSRGQALLGDALARTGDVKAARSAWLAAAGLNATEAQATALTARSLKEGDQAAARRDHARAERLFRRAALLAPERPEGYRGWSLSLLRLGSLKEALAPAERAAALGKADALNYLALGDVQAALGNADAARSSWQEALRLGYADARRRIERLSQP